MRIIGNISFRYFIIPGVLVVFFFLFYLIYDDVKERTIDEFNKEQLILAETAGRGIISLLKDYQSDMQFLVTHDEIITPNASTVKTMEKFRDCHSDIIEAVTRVDEKGVIQVTYPLNKSVIGRNIYYQKHVRDVISTHKPVISDVFRSAQGYDAIAIHVPIFKNKVYTGSLALLISFDKLGKLYLSRIKIRGTGSVWLLSANEIELFCAVKEHQGKSFIHNTRYHPSAVALLNRMKTDSMGLTRGVHQPRIENGKPVFFEKFIVFKRVPLENTYWTIVISFNDKDIFNSLNRLRNRIILVFSILFIFLVYYVYSIANVRKVISEENKRKKAEEDNQMLANALKSVNECVTITDLHNNVIFVNNAFTKIYGYELHELTGKNINIVDSAQNKLKVHDEIRIETIKGGWHGELINKRKDGTEIPISLSTTVLRDKKGNPIGLIGVASDISLRKKEEEELIRAKDRAEESDRLKSAFLANMSHEIRTPMNGIIGFASLLSEPELTREEMLNYITLIEKSGDRLLNLINDLVDIAKIESGMMEIVYEEVRIDELLDFAGSFFKPEANHKGIELVCINELSVEDFKIRSDREKLYAILTNLVKNAIKYTKKGYITAGVTRQNNQVLFYVKDSGIGIPADRLDAIFQRFVQADISDKMAHQGAGLGLSICKAYVEMLGGKIWVESEVDHGSVFYFTIPMEIKTISE